MNLDEAIARKTRILVVDDLQSARRILVRLLQKIGFENILEAGDGNTAMNLLESEAVGFIISDWEMPHLNGVEFLKRIREDEKTASVPFMMITSMQSRESVVEALDSGVNEYALKPFSLDVLRQKLEKIFEAIPNGSDNA